MIGIQPFILIRFIHYCVSDMDKLLVTDDFFAYNYYNYTAAVYSLLYIDIFNILIRYPVRTLGTYYLSKLTITSIIIFSLNAYSWKI